MMNDVIDEGHGELSNIVSRKDWRACPEIRECPPLITPVALVFTSTNTDSCTCKDDGECNIFVNSLQRIDMYMQHMPDIRYNFLIANTGKIYECRGWKKSPNLPDRFKEYNSKGIYVAFIGPGIVEVEESEMSEKMKDSYEQLIDYGVANGLISKKFLQFTLTRIEEEKDMFSMGRFRRS